MFTQVLSWIASWGWFIATGVGFVILGVAIAYGINQYRHRSRDPLLKKIGDEATREGYRQ